MSSISHSNIFSCSILAKLWRLCTAMVASARKIKCNWAHKFSYLANNSKEKKRGAGRHMDAKSGKKDKLRTQNLFMN